MRRKKTERQIDKQFKLNWYKKKEKGKRKKKRKEQKKEKEKGKKKKEIKKTRQIKCSGNKAVGRAGGR